MNLIQNPDFTNNGEGWQFHSSSGGSFVAVDGAAVLTVTAPGDNIQFYQAGLILQPSTRYRLEFDAQSSKGDDLSVFVHQHTAPYLSYGLDGYVAGLSPETRRYATRFTTPDATAADARLRFWLAPYAQSGAVYTIDNVVLVEEPDGEEPPEGGEPPRRDRRIHVAMERIGPGEVLEFRYVSPDKVVSTPDGDIDWDATPWKLVATYEANSD